jgi:hypothetical protein
MDSAHLPVAACPAEGCDGGPFETVAALRGHTNARSGPDHPGWQQVQQLIEERSGGQDIEEEEPTDGDADDTGEETEEMPTQEEYEEQHDHGESGDGTDADTSSDTSAGGGASLPMDPKTLGMLLAVALVLWLVYRALSGDGDDGQEVDQGDLGDGSGVETDTDTSDLGGGLQE